MADMLLCDRLEELWKLIDQQHLLYLELDESPRKVEQRNKLESSIKEYLHLSPHDRKFTLLQTANVLHRSAATKDNFNPYKAAVAWRAIGKYADNLVIQPWRKEYRDIKLYCGFYKHEIEESLVGAELMFEAMGYRHGGHSTMSLPDVLDPDRITSVSKDSIMAYVECQILKHIWDAVSTHHTFTWLEVLEFRENHTGTPDQAVRTLKYKLRQRQYQEHCQRTPHHTRPDCLYTQGYYNHSHYPSPYPVPPRYGPVVSPQLPPLLYQPYPPQHVIKPHDLYPSNGYHTHYQPPIPHNGYSASHHPPMPMYSVPSSVPIGQLIELDTSPVHNERSYNRYPKEEPRWQEPAYPYSKAKDDGAGSWENWDYVYRNLESHGYKKDLGARGDVLSPGNHPSTASHNNSSSQADVSPSDLSDRIRRVTLNVNRTETPKQEEPSGEVSSRPVKVVSETEVDAPRRTVLKQTESNPSPEKTKRRSSESGVKVLYETEAKINVNLDPISLPPEKAKSRSRTPEILVKKEDKWECITCTYLNPAAKDICEMCYKSKDRGSEQKPQPSGGQVCPKCTLVNEPKINLCAACGASLEFSPTYI